MRLLRSAPFRRHGLLLAPRAVPSCPIHLFSARRALSSTLIRPTALALCPKVPVRGASSLDDDPIAALQRAEAEADFVEDMLFPDAVAPEIKAVQVPEEANLGLQRDEPLLKGQVLSRLRIRRMRSEDEDARVASRSASNSDALTVTRKGDADDENGAGEGGSGDGDDEAFMNGMGSPQSSLSDVPLPYEDPAFADMILHMEVEGMLDETWQKSSKAAAEDCAALADILRHMKARDITCIDVSAKTSAFDYVMFATCEGPRHIKLCAWSISQADRVGRLSKPKRRMTDEAWDIVPVGRIVINLMQEAHRDSMFLERKWAVTKTMDPLDAANASVSEGRQVKAHGLWTLTVNLQDLEDFEVDYCKDALLSQL